MRAALYTFGIFVQPLKHPDNDGFHARNDPLLHAVERSPGFIARSGYPGDPGPKSWGSIVWPRFYLERGDEWTPATLSLWWDLESMMAFSYFGLHAEALAHGRQWFRKPEWPPYAVWWVEDEHIPPWREAVERHAHLHDHGPTARAFNFKQPFDANGRGTTIDRDRIKVIVDCNDGPGSQRNRSE